jgi:hypothetical protein
MKKLFTTVILIFCIASLHAQTQQKVAFPSGDASKNKNITAKVIPGSNNTWGYDISVGDKLMIHQLNIPGMPGNEGFKTKKAAQKVADLVISKMKKGEMPPSITKEELKKLKAI